MEKNLRDKNEHRKTVGMKEKEKQSGRPDLKFALCFLKMCYN